MTSYLQHLTHQIGEPSEARRLLAQRIPHWKYLVGLRGRKAISGELRVQNMPLQWQDWSMEGQYSRLILQDTRRSLQIPQGFDLHSNWHTAEQEKKWSDPTQIEARAGAYFYVEHFIHEIIEELRA